MKDLGLAIEIGGTKLQAALGFDGNGGLVTRRGSAPANEGAAAILEWFASSCQNC